MAPVDFNTFQSYSNLSEPTFSRIIARDICSLNICWYIEGANQYVDVDINKCLLSVLQIPIQGKLLKCTDTKSRLYNSLTGI